VGGCGDEKVEELLGADAGLVEQHLGRGGGQERCGADGRCDSGCERSGRPDAANA
jgi:hypothetical protein